jgi:hypothetical protein
VNFLVVNPLNAKLNPICHLLALLGAHRILHVSRIRVKHLFGFSDETQFLPHSTPLKITVSLRLLAVIVLPYLLSVQNVSSLSFIPVVSWNFFSASVS